MRARLAILLLAVPGVAAAQRPQPAARGAASIMAADGMEIANAAARPKWNPDSYKQIVTGTHEGP